MRHKSAVPVFPTWFLMSLGVIALVFLTLFGIVRSLMPGRDDSGALPPPPPAFSLPDGGASGPQAPVSLVPTTAPPTESAASPAPSPSAPASRSPARPTTRPPSRAAAPTALVTGRYSVFSTFRDSFIGEVAVTNTTGRPQGWTATLTFPSNVGALVTSWLEGLPQPQVKQSGRTFTWTSSQPLPAGATGQLRFHLKRTGSGDRASSCAVNGTACR